MIDDFNSDDAGVYEPFSREEFNLLIRGITDSSDDWKRFFDLVDSGDFAFSPDESKADYDRRGRCVVALQCIAESMGEELNYHGHLIDTLDCSEWFGAQTEDVVTYLENVVLGYVASSHDHLVLLENDFKQWRQLSDDRAKAMAASLRQDFAVRSEEYSKTLFCFDVLLKIRDALHLNPSEFSREQIPGIPDLEEQRGFDPDLDDGTNVVVLGR